MKDEHTQIVEVLTLAIDKIERGIESKLDRDEESDKYDMAITCINTALGWLASNKAQMLILNPEQDV